MMMLSIESFPQRIRAYYLVALAAMARADGQLDETELEFLERKISEFQLTRHYRDRVITTARNGLPRLFRHMRKLKDNPLRYSLILELMVVAMGDGVLMDEERMLFHELAEALDIEDEYVYLLTEFVAAVHFGAQLPCPEPLYEHSIESMFRYFIAGQIPLLENCAFCLASPDYDQALKQRLLQSGGVAAGAMAATPPHTGSSL